MPEQPDAQVEGQQEMITWGQLRKQYHACSVHIEYGRAVAYCTVCEFSAVIWPRYRVLVQADDPLVSHSGFEISY